MDGRRAEVVDSDDEALQARLEELCVGRQQRLTGAPPAISPSLSEEVDDERPVYRSVVLMPSDVALEASSSALPGGVISSKQPPSAVVMMGDTGKSKMPVGGASAAAGSSSSSYYDGGASSSSSSGGGRSRSLFEEMTGDSAAPQYRSLAQLMGLVRRLHRWLGGGLRVGVVA